jgi:hypothetical protein
MKVRGTIAGTPLRAKLTALCWGALTLLVPVAVSACTSSTSTTPPTIISPTVPSGGASFASTPSSTTHATGDTSTPSAPASPAVAQVTVTQTITVSPDAIPPAAPVTGGGGTAGFQDSLLLALGAAAILAGAGGLIYRRWLGRGH